ncbi:Double-strand-break repair protein rad21 homolog [Rhizoctonia solani]|uniref:Double-strand-break repair protein rad21 homolog n=1 Tax=Rhizoctonia solani TaxID=456999 RepID=A0A0K6FK73_9AGAM|nr:Double-strand-break repair protein rad21 homolog [Rhizoctonia solani]
MFYSEAILSRRGPLGKVWLAAHWERKLSKNQTLQTDISESVDAILGQEIVPMALRLSGQLLLGVCRIYSRKAKYLLDDCNEALLKIRLAFRPGIVDMTEDQLQVPRNAITLSGEGIDIDLLMPDMNWDLDFVASQIPATTQNIARPGDITLANAGDITLALDDTGYGFDLGPLDGIGSQDIDFDLGLDLDGDRAPSAKDGEGDETMSLEAPRDAPAPRSARESLASAFHGRGDDDLERLSQRSRSKTRELSFEPGPGPGFDVTGMDIDIEGLDGGLDLGIGFEEPPALTPGPATEVAPATPAAGPEDTTQLEGEKTPLADRSRASTPLSEPPPTPGAGDVLPGITPKTAERISKKAEETEKLSGRKKTTAKKLVVDSVAELAEERRGRRDEDLSAIQTEQQFLPNNTTVARLLEIRADPIAHFLPTKTTPNGTFFCAAPPGLPPALAEMFMFPTTNLRRPRGATPAPQAERDEEEELRTPKRARISVPGEEPEVEYGMHREPSERAPSERPLGPDVTLPISEGFEGFSGLGDDQPFNIGDVTLDISTTRQPSLPKSRAQSLAADDEVRSRYSTPGPGPGRTFEDAECAIAAFDHRTKSSETQTQASESDTAGEGQIKGVSKNTAKALALLQDRLQPDEAAEEKVLSFAQVSTKATRRAASAFFFELLLLSTRDCVKVSQESEFANIEVRAKDRLWEQHVPAPGEVDPGREATPSVSSVIEGEMD